MVTRKGMAGWPLGTAQLVSLIVLVAASGASQAQVVLPQTVYSASEFGSTLGPSTQQSSSPCSQSTPCVLPTLSNSADLNNGTQDYPQGNSFSATANASAGHLGVDLSASGHGIAGATAGVNTYIQSQASSVLAQYFSE